MIVTKHVKHHVSMGNYEWVEFGAEVTFDTEGGPLNAGILATVDDALETLISEELSEARLNTAEKKSYVHIYKKED